MTNHYETHVTLSNAKPDVLVQIRQWAESQGMKWTQILLDAGKTPLQPMVTFWGTESVSLQRQRIDQVRRMVDQLGGTVVRVKIEGDIDNDDVPQKESDLCDSSDRYFEHHVKVVTADRAELEQIGRLASQHNARLSQNTRRQRTDGRCERFVTQRVSACGRAKAASQLDQMVQSFVRHKIEILEVEAEYVLVDSNIEVDAGWF